MKINNIIVLVIFILYLSAFVSACDKKTYEASTKKAINNNKNSNIITKNDEAVDISGNVRWKFLPNSELISEFTISDGFAVVCGKLDENNYKIYCIELDTGSWFWTYDIDHPVKTFLIIDERLFFNVYADSEDSDKLQELYCLDLYRGTLLWNMKHAGHSAGTPIVIKGVLFFSDYVKSENISNIYSISAYNGEILWKKVVKGYTTGDILYEDNKIFTFVNGYLYSFRAYDGTFLWEYGYGERDVELFLKDSYVYISSHTGEIHKINIQYGNSAFEFKIAKTFNEKEYTLSNISINKGIIYAVIENKLLLFDENGKNINNISIKGSINKYSTPIMSEHYIYIASSKFLNIIDNKSKLLKYIYPLSGVNNSYPIIYKDFAYIIDKASKNGGLTKISVDDESNENIIYAPGSPQTVSISDMNAYGKFQYSYDRNELMQSDNTAYGIGDIIWEKSSIEKIYNFTVNKGRLFYITKNSLKCLNISDSYELWSMPVENINHNNILVLGDYLFVLSNDGKVHKFRTDNGLREWVRKISPAKNINNTKILLFEDNLIISNFDNYLLLVDVVLGNVSASIELKKPVAVNPYISNGSIIAIDINGNVYSYNIKDKNSDWESLIAGTKYGMNSEFDFSVYINGIDNEIISLDTFNGEIKWTFSDNADFYGKPVVYGDKVYTASNKGIYCLIEGYPEKLHWFYKTENKVCEPIIIKDGRLYAFTDKGRVICVSAETGYEQWTTNIASSIVNAKSFVHGYRLFVFTDSGLIIINSLNGEDLWKIKTNTNIVDIYINDNRLYILGSNNILTCYYIKDDIAIKNQLPYYKIKEDENFKIEDKIEDENHSDEPLELSFIDKSKLEGKYKNINNNDKEKDNNIINTIADKETSESSSLSKYLGLYGVKKKLYTFPVSKIKNYLMKKDYMYAVMVDENGNDIISIYDIANNKIIWQEKFNKTITTKLFVYKNLIYAGNENGELICLNTFSGNLVWDVQLNSLPKSIYDLGDSNSLLVITNNTIYIIDMFDGTIIMQKTGFAGISETIIYKQTLYLYTIDGLIYSLDSNLSTKQLYENKGSGFISLLFYYDDNVYVLDDKGYLLIISATDGVLKNEIDLGSKIVGDYVFDEITGYLYYCNKNELVCYNIINLEVKWTKDIQIKYKSKILYNDSILILYTDADYIYCVDAIKGELLWNDNLHIEIIDATSVIDGKLYMFADNIFYELNTGFDFFNADGY